MNIKRTLSKIVTASIIGLATLIPSNKAESGVKISLAFKDKYVVVPGFIPEKEPVVQPSITLNKDGLYGMIWSNFNTKKKEFTEVDYIIGYNNNLMGLNFDVSYNLFDFKNLGKNELNDNLHELWLNLTKKYVVSPSLRFVQNFSGGNLKNSKGSYITLTLNHNNSIGKIPISLEGSLQYNNRYFIENRGFSIAQADFSLPFELNDISITPKIRFRKALDKDNFENSTDFGLSLDYKF